MTPSPHIILASFGVIKLPFLSKSSLTPTLATITAHSVQPQGEILEEGRKKELLSAGQKQEMDL